MPEATRIKDLPASEKPRERLLAKGANALRDSELIAILLQTGTQGLSAIDVAQSLLTKFGSLEALAKAPVDEMRVKASAATRRPRSRLHSAWTSAWPTSSATNRRCSTRRKNWRAFAQGQSTAGGEHFHVVLVMPSGG